MATPSFAGLSKEARRAIACMIDPAVFSKEAGIDPDDWQAQLLRSNRRQILVNCSRQSGKSTTLGTLAVHEAIYVPGSLSLIVSPTQRQSGELFRKALDVYQTIGRPIASEAESALKLELENGSRIIALPGKDGTIRGYSGVNLLLMDESAFVSDSLYRTVRPMLAVSQGRVVAAGTPFGTRGWWYEAWEFEGQSWEHYEVMAEQCPRIPAEFLAEEQRRLGEFWFEQEYHCKFLDAQSSAFRAVDIQALFDTEIETWEM